MRLGFGVAFEADSPAVRAAAEAGLGLGPPDPSTPLSADDWIARFAELPLLEQPGTVWRYELAHAVLGVVLARAAGRPLDRLLHEKLLRLMTTDRLTPAQRDGPSAQAFLGGGWGYGVQVLTPDHDPAVRLARYGWGGGLGTLWYSWPERCAAAVLLAQVLPRSGALVETFVAGMERTLTD